MMRTGFRGGVGAGAAGWLVVLAYLGTGAAWGQARPTARQAVRVSAFGGVTASSDALGGGHTTGITAGGDVNFPTIFQLQPSLELRGSYPVSAGGFDSQKTLLGGLKVERQIRRLRPYGDLLFGRGEIDYGRGLVNPGRTMYYLRSVSNVLAAGVGVDVDLNDRLGLKTEVQWERFIAPVSESGNLTPQAITIGVVYRLNFNRSRHRL